MTAGTTGYSSNYVGEHQESLTNSLLYDLVNHMYTFLRQKHQKIRFLMPSPKRFRKLQPKVIASSLDDVPTRF